MRPIEIPRILFDALLDMISKDRGIRIEAIEIHKGIVKGAVKENINCKVVFFQERQAVVGLYEENINSRIFSSLNIWYYDTTSNFNPHDFLKEKIRVQPSLSITGGPFVSMEWQCGRGFKLQERVGADYNHKTINIIKEADFLKLMGNIMDVALELVYSEEMQLHDYWQAYKNPDAYYGDKP